MLIVIANRFEKLLKTMLVHQQESSFLALVNSHFLKYEMDLMHKTMSEDRMT
jgi:hypothetical protein